MFDLSVEKLFILAIVALFVLDPQRLPAAASALARTLRQIKNFASDANDTLRGELGPELDELRPALNDLRDDLADLRTWRDHRSALPHHLTHDPTEFHRHPPEPRLAQPPPIPAPDRPPPRPLTVGQRPPIDPDAT